MTWLRRAAVSNTPKAILRNIEKLEFLKGAGVARWALDGLSPNRLKRLAQVARRAAGQALQRMPEERRYPLLVLTCSGCGHTLFFNAVVAGLTTT